MTPASLSCSVIIPTHNRRDSLLRLLRALAAGLLPPARFEVIVVADGCSDDTIDTVRQTSLPLELQVIEQTPGRGAANARNLGSRRARAPLLVFIDDDMEPLPTLLSSHLEIHEEGNADGDPPVVIGAPLPVRQTVPSFNHIAVSEWWEQQFERMATPGYRFSYDDVFSGVLSVSAQVFERAGGFDTGFNSCRDDSELGVRLIQLGARIVFSKAAGGVHHEIRDQTALLARKQAEGRADLRLAQLHPELWPRLWLKAAGTEPRRLRILRRVALSRASIRDPMIALQLGNLAVLERLRLHGLWRFAHAAAVYYSYWVGVGKTLGNSEEVRRVLNELAAAHLARSTGSVREIELDLALGLPAAEQRLDRERPDAATVRWGAFQIGRIPPIAGAERLRGVHLRRQLETVLSARLAEAIAIQEVGTRSELQSIPPRGS